jgi:hypothetical protein
MSPSSSLPGGTEVNHYSEIYTLTSLETAPKEPT